MTDQPAPATADMGSPAAVTGEDRILPGVIYVLYLVGPANGLTLILGLVLAYLMKGSAGPKAATHYDFQIRTFWMSIGWFLIAGLLFVVGLALSIVLIGIPAVIAGSFIFSVIGIWFVVRCVMGLVYLARDEAYPRPNSWLV